MTGAMEEQSTIQFSASPFNKGVRMTGRQRYGTKNMWTSSKKEQTASNFWVPFRGMAKSHLGFVPLCISLATELQYSAPTASSDCDPNSANSLFMGLIFLLHSLHCDSSFDLQGCKLEEDQFICV